MVKQSKETPFFSNSQQTPSNFMVGGTECFSLNKIFVTYNSMMYSFLLANLKAVWNYRTLHQTMQTVTAQYGYIAERNVD